MNRFHREVKTDTRTGRPCGFCMRLDPDFACRNPLDQLVRKTDRASGHITEEGHVRHRVLEVCLKLPDHKRGRLLDPAA